MNNSIKPRTVKQIIQRLSLADQKKFLRFLKGIESREALHIMAIEMREPDVSDQVIWQKMYPNNPYKDSTFRRNTELLMGRLESYLAWQALEKRPQLKKAYFIQGLAESDVMATDGFASRYRKALRQIDRDPLRNSDYYEARSLILKYGFQMQVASKAQEGSPFYNSITYHEEMGILQRVLYHFCLMHTLTKKGERLTLFDQLWDMEQWLAAFQQCQPLLDAPLPRFLIRFLQFLYQQTGISHQILQELMEVKAYLRPDEFSNLFAILLSKQIQLLRQGEDIAIYEQILTLYRTGFEEGFLRVNGQIQLIDYNNYTTYYSLLIKFKGAAHFANNKDHIIEEFARYKAFLHPDWAENAYAFGIARIYSAFGDYQKITQQYRAWEFPYVTVALNYNLTAFEAFYELGQFRSLPPKMKNLLDYLKAHIGELKTETYQSYQDRIRLFRKLARLQLARVSKREKLERALRLQQKLEANLSTHGKKWLLAKVNALIAALEEATARKY